MKYFNISSFTAPEYDLISPTICSAKGHIKCKRLHSHVRKALSQYILNVQEEAVERIQKGAVAIDMPSVSVRVEYCCRSPPCNKSYRYAKSRRKHEEKVHGLFVDDETTASANTATKSDEAKEDKNDDVYNYAVARLSLALLIHCVDDAVREGDGDRIILCWRFFLLYYKAFNHSKYAFAGFLLLANVTVLLPEAKAHSLIWNRTVSNKGGKGKNMSLDVRLEQWNCLTKELISHLGVNLNEKCAKREANAIAFLEEILLTIDKDLSVKRPSGKHTVQKKEKDTKTLVGEFVKHGIFNYTPGHKYSHFKDFDSNILSRIDITVFSNWLKEQRKKSWKNTLNFNTKGKKLKSVKKLLKPV